MLKEKLDKMIEEHIKFRSDYIEIFALAMALQNYDKIEDYVLVEDRQQLRTIFYFMKKEDLK